MHPGDFSGHDHLYEHGRASNGVRYVVSGGGGAPLYETEPEGSLEVHPRDVVRNEVIYNYQVVEVEGADVRVSTYECDGELLEAFEVRAAAPCADPADCAGELHDVCPGAWACDAGRCRWACPDEPECVAAPMCAHLEPGEGSGRWACVKGACAWEPGEAAPGEPSVADTRAPEPAPETVGPAQEAGAAEVVDLTTQPVGSEGGACALSSRRAPLPMLSVLLAAALACLRVRRSRSSR